MIAADLALLLVAFALGICVGIRARERQRPARRQEVTQVPIELLVDGDVLVLQTEKILSLDQMHNVRKLFEDLASKPYPKMIVLDPGLSLSVLRRAQGGPLPAGRAYLVGEKQA